jgi:hypothetical protein
MADIIQFTPRERSEGVPRSGEPASVIIFPGVRYERSAREARNSEPPQSGDRPSRRARRRRLS